MKKSTFFICVLTFLVLFSSMFYMKLRYKQISAEDTLVKSFKSSGAEVVSSEIYFWGKADGKNDNMMSIKQIAAELSQEMGVLKDKSFSPKVIDNDSIKKVEFDGIMYTEKKQDNKYEASVEKNNKQVMIRVQLEGNKDTGFTKTVSVSVSQDLQYEGLYEIKKKASKAFKKYGITPKVNSCITGSFQGKLGYERLNGICSKVFSSVDAKKVEGISEGSLISVSAYSGSIGDSIKVNGKKVNLNLAIRYNRYEGKTYLWIASPVITTEY